MVSHLVSDAPALVLDVATGPGGVARMITRRSPARVVGLDVTEPMLELARAAARSENLDDRISLVRASGERLPFPDATFDAVSFTYLLRYVRDPAATLRELVRVAKPGGVIANLEFAVPPAPWWRAAWFCYTRGLLPLGGLLLGGREWYEVGRFLGPSITEHYRRFPIGWTVRAWEAAGATDVRLRRMSLGGGLVMWGRKESGQPD